MSKADVAAVVLWSAVTLYAIFAGADFGAGLWDLIAGDAERGARPRALIDRVLTPVWEANHVWLIFMLVVTWTAFPDAFGPIMSTLFVPLSLAALGIVLRGSGFAFRHVVRGRQGRRALGATFALASVVTPFFLGTVAGAIATGRVPSGGSGDRLTSWFNITSVAIGVLLVATCAYIAAVFLVTEARRAGDDELERYFRTRAIAAALVAGGVATLSLVLLNEHAPALFDDLVGGSGLPLVILSVLCGLGAIGQLLRGGRGTRVLAAGALAAVVFGWGAAQWPEMLPGLTLGEAAAPGATLDALLVVFVAALLIVVPAIVLLFTLQQRHILGEGDESG